MCVKIINKKIMYSFIIILLYVLSIFIKPLNIISILIRAFSGLIICFYIIGDSINFLFNKYFKLNFGSIFGEFSYIFLLSFSYFLVISIILCYKYLLNSYNICFIFITSISLFYLVGYISKNKVNFERNLNNYGNILPIIFIFFIGLLLAFIFLKDYKWPSIPGWDIYVHLGNSNWIIENNGTTNLIPNLFTKIIPYPYLFHVIISSFSLFIFMDPFNIFWVIVNV
ncbi:hypothetical protein MCGE09_00580 [Thaumarchaeota archaeon SCGC AB-539-E09]|nr:hypothetical protein MCGE09_00580 [Thaumarchaeota archaeon SCGC AB-539-E09]